MDSSKPIITKETKNKLQVDYEGKLSFKERLLRKFKTSNTWIKIVVNIFRFILMLGVSYVILFPFVSKIAGSFMSKEDVVDATVSLIPKNPTIDIYKYIVLDNNYLGALLNTVLLSLICAFIQTFVSCLVGYGLAKFKFKGNKLIMVLVVITMIIPHNTLRLCMIRFFGNFDIAKPLSFGFDGIIKAIFGETLYLINTFWPFALLSLGGIAFKNGLYIYLMRQFFKGVPDELEESAYVDGAGVFRTFFQIILPLAVPMMITIFLFSFSWQWTDEFYVNSFFTGINAPWMMPDIIEEIPLHLRTEYAGKQLYNNVIVNTAGIMIIAPLVIMYLFCQKFLVQGIERSGLVG